MNSNDETIPLDKITTVGDLLFGQMIEDREAACLNIKRRVKVQAYHVWVEAGEPRSIKPVDLESPGFFGWALAWNYHKENGGSFEALGETFAKRRMIDEVRLVLSRSAHEREIAWLRGDIHPDQAEGARLYACAGDGDPQEAIAARVDFETALKSAGGLDGVLAMLLMVVGGAVPVEDPELAQGLRSLLLAHEGDPKAALESFLPLMIPNPTGGLPIPRRWYVDECLKRATKHVLEKTRLDDVPTFLERARVGFEGEAKCYSEVLAARLKLSPTELAEMLKPYEIHSRRVQIDGVQRQGYLLGDFADSEQACA